MENLHRLLVVMEPDVLEDENRVQTSVIRALELADRTGCEIELFSNCFETTTLAPSLWAGSDAIEAQRQQRLDERFEWLEDIAGRLRKKGYAVDSEAVWSYPRAQAISHKALTVGSDLVLKQPDDHRYIAGIFSNTDWELIRTCPVPCLFTKTETPQGAEHGVLACIDPTQDADDEYRSASLDYGIYEVAQKIATALSVPIDVVNAYQIPASMAHQLISYAPAIPSLAGRALPVAEGSAESSPAERHGRALQAFADYFQHPVEKIIIEEGRPAEVICRAAALQKSSMIVMGALERGRLQRALLSVNAEPVLAMAPCDVLFVKPADHSVVLEKLEAPVLQRRSRETALAMLQPVDINQAMVDPAATFAEPMFVNRRPDLSTHQKRKILRSWELDEVRLQESAYEGELASNESELLTEVKTAEHLLAEPQKIFRDNSKDDQPQQNHY